MLQITALILGIISIILPFIPILAKKNSVRAKHTMFSVFSFLLCSIALYLPMIDMRHWALNNELQNFIDCAPTYHLAEIVLLISVICVNIFSFCYFYKKKY